MKCAIVRIVMIPYFNTSGPCIPGKHYMLTPEGRLRYLLRLVGEEKYFTVHGGRQVGKTTLARWLVEHYNQGNTYRALWVDLQTARETDSPTEAMPLVLESLEDAIEWAGQGDTFSLERSLWLTFPKSAVYQALRSLSKQSPLPLIVLFDEADGLTGESMVSFLTQLRKGYLTRDRLPFPHTVALIGQRQVRDYVVKAEERRAVTWLGSTSPFNITAEAATVRMFTVEEVTDLLEQHTAKTGQVFTPEASAYVFYLSQGHPWIVNALAAEAVTRLVEDRTQEVTKAHIEQAKETIIRERRTNIDSLLARLREERVRKIIDPMIAGADVPADVVDDDYAYVLGLGLVAMRDGILQIANPVYREVVIRTLTYVKQHAMGGVIPAWYVSEDGSLKMGELMGAWQEFWREGGHLAAEGFRYKESGPHLMMMAFLQRVVNGGGRIDREYGLGRGALDLLVEWKGTRHAVELKIRRDERTEGKGLKQLAGYLDHLGLQEGWLVLFDLRKELSWEQKLFRRNEQVGDRLIHVVGV